MLCPTPPYGTRLGSVGDLINESYHVLFVNDIHCLMFKSSTKLNLVLYGGVGCNIDRHRSTLRQYPGAHIHSPYCLILQPSLP